MSKARIKAVGRGTLDGRGLWLTHAADFSMDDIHQVNLLLGRSDRGKQQG